MIGNNIAGSNYSPCETPPAKRRKKSSDVRYVQASRHCSGEDYGVCSDPGQSQQPLVKVQPWCACTWVCSGSLGVEAATTPRTRTQAKPPTGGLRLLSPHLLSAWNLITNRHWSCSPFRRPVSHTTPASAARERGLALLRPSCLPPSAKQAVGTRGPLWHPGCGSRPRPGTWGLAAGWAEAAPPYPVKPQASTRRAPVATATCQPPWLPRPQSLGLLKVPRTWMACGCCWCLEVTRSSYFGRMWCVAEGEELTLLLPRLLPSLRLPCQLCSSCRTRGAALSPELVGVPWSKTRLKLCREAGSTRVLPHF